MLQLYYVPLAWPFYYSFKTIFQSFDNLLTRLDQFDFPRTQEYTALVQKLEQTKKRQREITTDEMQAVLEQRDMTLAKVYIIFWICCLLKIIT